MDSRKFVLKQTAIVALGQALCVAVMLGICALLGYFDTPVWLGGILGGVLAIVNFFFMALGAMLAADKAEEQNVKGGKAVVQISYLVRTAVLFLILFALVKSQLCNVITAVVPLIFTRPILTVAEFFRKSGEKQA